MSDALDPARRALVTLSAAIATRDGAAIDAALRAASADADPTTVEEVLLQSHLFVGFPAVLEAMRRWAELGDATPGPGSEAEAPPAEWAARGERVCAVVYGDAYGKLRRSVAALHPALDRWMVETGYGRVLGRPGLDLATRELCVAALLLVWDAPRQLHSHLRGALNAGASPQELREVLAIAGRFVEPERRAAAAALLDRVEAAAGRREPG